MVQENDMTAVELALSELGESPDSVASALRERDIQSFVTQVNVPFTRACQCPIARFLQSLGYDHVYVSCTQAIVGEQFDCHVLPRAVCEFILASDQGEYPDLDAGGYRP